MEHPWSPGSVYEVIEQQLICLYSHQEGMQSPCSSHRKVMQ